MKVVFTYFPYAVRYNHGSALLASICRQNGLNSFIVPMENIAEYQYKVNQISPAYVCVSYVCEHDYIASLPYVKWVKEQGYKILAGGVYARKGAYIEEDYFDYVCRGDGKNLPNFFLHNDTSVFDKYSENNNLDDLPLPDYDCITGFEFARGWKFLERLKVIPYSSSRGCPYTCFFCDSLYQSANIRIRSKIKEDLNYLYERYMPDLFYFMDELIPYYNKQWKVAFEGNPYKFFGYIRADISKDNLLFLYNNGMRGCAFGVESGDENFRNEIMGKELLDSSIWETVGLLKSLNIAYMPFFMTGHPYETDSIRKSTFNMLQKIGGDPVIWQYEDLDKKTNIIPKESIEKYCANQGINIADFKRINFEDKDTHVTTKDNSFLVYKILDNSIYISEVWGDGAWAYEQLEELCRMYNKKSMHGIVKSHGSAKAFEYKYGFKITGHIVEKEVN